MKTLAYFFLISISCLLMSCLTTSSKAVSPKASAPIPLFGDDANPDVIWMIRNVSIPESNSQKKSGSQKKQSQTLYGLFACYRKPISEPGAPVCYLAETVWDPNQLIWPGNYSLIDGELHRK